MHGPQRRRTTANCLLKKRGSTAVAIHTAHAIKTASAHLSQHICGGELVHNQHLQQGEMKA